MDETYRPFHPTLRDPRTGKPLQALGLFRGRPLWPMMGGSEDADVDSGAGEADADDATDDADADKEGKDGKDGKASDKKDTSSDEVVPLSKHKDLQKKLGLADRKRQAAEDKLKEIELKDLPEAERIKTERDEAVQKVGVLEGKYTNLARSYAFLLETQTQKIRWKNPKAALRLAELDELSINEDGSVEGISDAIAALLKEHAYLVDEDKDEKDEEDDKASGKKTRSGSLVGSRGKGTKPDGKPSDEELRRMFPALNK